MCFTSFHSSASIRRSLDKISSCTPDHHSDQLEPICLILKKGSPYVACEPSQLNPQVSNLSSQRRDGELNAFPRRFLERRQDRQVLCRPKFELQLGFRRGDLCQQVVHLELTFPQTNTLASSFFLFFLQYRKTNLDSLRSRSVFRPSMDLSKLHHIESSLRSIKQRAWTTEQLLLLLVPTVRLPPWIPRR